jgi:pyruvate/2-oxoglutarate dehydrogenase complex dihydrolipoamide dehydrogenase (E3) component
LIGGSCPNTNCLPGKNEIWSAKVADLVHHADRFGIVTGSTATDMKRVLAQARYGRRPDRDAPRQLQGQRCRADHGNGSFIAPKTIEVSLNDGGTRVLTGDRVVLNLGKHATIPDIPGLAAAAPLTNVYELRYSQRQ